MWMGRIAHAHTQRSVNVQFRNVLAMMQSIVAISAAFSTAALFNGEAVRIIICHFLPFRSPRFFFFFLSHCRSSIESNYYLRFSASSGQWRALKLREIDFLFAIVLRPSAPNKTAFDKVELSQSCAHLFPLETLFSVSSLFVRIHIEINSFAPGRKFPLCDSSVESERKSVDGCI